MKFIEINKARQNNLKGLNVKIPLGSLTLICGLSGSGKSSLAFETLYAEGQRRYLQSLSNYLRQYILLQSPPDVESISNLPPALALEQKNMIKSSRSTVSSLSGLADHLRLIFEKLGRVYCPRHQIPLESFSPDRMVKQLLEDFKGERAFVIRRVFRERISSSPDLFLKNLRKKGYSRILSSKGQKANLNQLKDLGDLKSLPRKDFYLLLDRFALEERQTQRIKEAFRQGFSLTRLFPSESSAFSEEVLVQSLKGGTRFFSKKAKCPECAYEFPLPLSAALFSFSSPLGACPSCEGYGYRFALDQEKVIPNPKLSLQEGAIHAFQNPSASFFQEALREFCTKKQIPYTKAWCDLTPKQRLAIWKGQGAFRGITGWFQGLEKQRYKLHIRILLSRYRSSFACSACKGFRLRPELNHVLFHGKSFKDYMKMNLGTLKKFFDREKMSTYEQSVCAESFQSLNENLKFLNAIGLSYLGLNRKANSLSGGEFQRLNLASQLGLRLSQLLYVLDEPTVGLHPRDTARLIELLQELKAFGNTVVVVEHDQDFMASSDYIIEIGPGSGKRGGELICSGSREDFLKSKNSNTVPYLKRQGLSFKTTRPVNKSAYKYRLLLNGCSGRNLKNLDFFVPLNRFVIVTGVSGSGKSSLVTDTLYPALLKSLSKELDRELEGLPEGLAYKELLGANFLKSTVFMNPSTAGKNIRSSVLSFIKVFDIVRQKFALSQRAKRQGFKSSDFSLNVEGGRCPACRGRGYQEIDMVFMDPLKAVCEDCKGKKYKKQILKVRLKDKNIDEVLNLTVTEAIEFFKGEAQLLRAFSSLREVGLSYLTLGQSLSSLSGGERQRLKLSRELLSAQQEKTLYILDEPTKGLHFKELELIVQVIDRMVSAGASFLAVEHNLDFIKEADYLIDIGPEAGSAGGKILFEGAPAEIIHCKKSWTGQFLKHFMEAETKTEKKSRSKA